MLSKRTADIGVAVILLAIGIAQFVGGLTMDRLEIRKIHPASIPGLVPIFLGLAMAGMAAMLIVGQMRALRAGTPDTGDGFTRDEIRRLGAVGGLCLVYALVLVGNVHFWLASSLFVGVFTALFEPAGPISRQRRLLRFAAVGVFAVLIGGAISLMFESAFLVRLP